MILGTWTIVAWGVIGAVLLGLGMALDITGLVILAFIVLVGGIGIGAVTKIRKGAVAPASCPNCGGLVSPNAPFCKHCGEPLRSRA
ncbi:MAG: zinc ribbon domain-containing protein [Actinomycetota bacterium]